MFKKIILLFGLTTLFVTGCASKQAGQSIEIPGHDRQNPNIPMFATSNLVITYAEIGGPDNLDTKLVINHDGTMTLTKKGANTQHGALTQDQLQSIVNAFYENNFYDVPESYLATQIVEGISRTLILKDDNGQKMVNFYKQGAPVEFLNITDRITHVAMAKFK